MCLSDIIVGGVLCINVCIMCVNENSSVRICENVYCVYECLQVCECVQEFKYVEAFVCVSTYVIA